MDQVKIGQFMKELRKEKGVTQEQLAEVFQVSNRTVSRWENGNNMPDLDILIEISDYYEIDLRELLNGERKSETMDKEFKDTLLQAVDYSNTEAEKCNKRVRLCNCLGMLLMVIVMLFKDSTVYNYNEITMHLFDAMQGMSIGMLFVALMFSSRYGAKIRAFKKRIMKKTSN